MKPEYVYAVIAGFIIAAFIIAIAMVAAGKL